MAVLHIVPCLDVRNSGISAAAKMLATSQGAEMADARGVSPDVVRAADVVWVHSMWTPQVWRACRIAAKCGKPFVRMTHGCLSPVSLSYHRFRKMAVSPLERRLFRRCSAIAVTCADEREWCERWGLAGPFEMVDLKRFFSFPTEPPALPHIAGRAARVLFIGRRHPLKGLDCLEEAVRGSSAQLRVETDAFGADKEAAFAWCDVLVLPSLSENFGLVVAEALERGKPVITTDGAPAWRNHPGVVYLEGFRDGTVADRVRLLRETILRMAPR